MSPDDPRHGRPSGYNAGCRCSPCSIAERRAMKKYHVRRLAMGGSTTVDATRAAATIKQVHQRMSYSAMARAIGSSHSYLTKIARGEVKRISPDREAAILKLAGFRPVDTSHVNPLPARRRVQALYALGYTFPRITAETGYNLSSVKKLAYDPWPVIEARYDRAIRDAYDRLCMTLPASDVIQERSGITRARNAARRNGWVPPLAWDDIDDPAEKPHRTAYAPARDDEYDEAAVIRLISGDHIPARPADKIEAMRRWVAKGGSARELCRIHGWKEGRYVIGVAA